MDAAVNEGERGVVSESSETYRGGISGVGCGIVDGAGDGFTMVHHGDGCGVDSDASGEVSGAIDGIDYPAKVSRTGDSARKGWADFLLDKDGVPRVSPSEFTKNHPLSGMVGFGHGGVVVFSHRGDFAEIRTGGFGAETGEFACGGEEQ